MRSLVNFVGALIANLKFGLILTLFVLDPLRMESQYKQQLGSALLLGLDLVVASDVIDTIMLEGTLNNVAALGLLVIIVEVEGRWPWQSRTIRRSPHGVPCGKFNGTGVIIMDNSFSRVFEEMVGRTTGPMWFRVILEPLVGAILGILAMIGAVLRQ